MDDGEFVERYREYLPMVAKFLARRVEPQQVEDLCSEVFEIAWRKREAAPAGYELAWLFKIAGNLVNNHRRRHHTASRFAHLFAVEHYAPSAESIALKDMELAGAWALLKPAEQQVLALAVLDDLPVNQVAKVLGLSPNAVSVRLSRARVRLAQFLKSAEPSS